MFSLILGTVFVILMLYLLKSGSCGNGAIVFPGGLPVIGHGLLFIRKDIFSIVKDLSTHSIDNGGISVLYIGWKKLYIIAKPEEGTTVLTKCLEKMFVYKYIEPLFGDTLVSAEGVVWKRNRRILDLAFKQPILDSYLKVFNNQAIRLDNTLSKKVGVGYVDVTHDVTRSVLETTCQTTMGMRVDDENFVTDEYVKALHRVFEIVTIRLQKQWLIFDTIFNRSSLKKEQDQSLGVIHEISAKMVKIQKSLYLQRLKNEDKRNDNEEIRCFLQIIFENSVTPEGSVFTDHQLRCLCDNVLFAAFDTSTYELLFTLICIGSDADVQNRVYQEVIDVLGEEEAVTREHLSKLVYLEAAIKEAVRLYPIGPIVARDATTDIQLGKVTIPAGSSIAVHLWAINRNEAYWGPDAEEYNPGRWLNLDTLPEHPNAFASFSFGRRNCIGKLYAMMYMKTTLAAIIRKYRITSDHTRMEFDCYTMLKVKSGHLMKFEMR